MGLVLATHATLALDGSWDLTKFSVSRMGLSQPPMSARGSKTVKTKRGIGGRVEVMFEVGKVRMVRVRRGVYL